MALANDDGEIVELVNAARVKAYTDNLAPTMGLRGCEDCEGLPEALGDEYTTPAGDDAPWYDPTDPATAGFYGVYPLGFEGIDDSTRSIESAELSGDGSVVVGSRFTGKDIRVTGVAFAKDEESLSAGVSWLNSALNGTESGRCFGDRLNVYSSCPPVEILPPDFATPYILETPPSEEELAAWTTTSGSITGSAAGVNFQWTEGDPQKVACREITGLIPGEQYQLRTRLEAFGDYFVRIGDSCAGGRTNLAPNPLLLGWQFFGAGIASVQDDVATGGPLGLGFRRAITTSSNAGTEYTLLGDASDGVPVVSGAVYQGSAYVLGDTSTAALVAQFYDAGGTLLPGEDVVLEDGVAMDSTWHRLTGIAKAPDDAATMRLGIFWTVGVGDVEPNTTFGGANMLVEVPPYEVLRTNLFGDQRATSSAASWGFDEGDDGDVTSTFVTSAVDGPVLYEGIQSDTYRRHTVTTAPTSGSAGPYSGTFAAILTYPSVIPAGTRWEAGAFYRANRSVSGVIRYEVFGVGGVVLESVDVPFTLTADTWTYITGGQDALSDLSQPREIRASVLVGGDGGGAAIEDGDIYDSTGGIIQIGSTDDAYFDHLRPVSDPLAYIGQEGSPSQEIEVDDVGTYFDGNTPGYRWSGTPNNSTSTLIQGTDYETIFGWGTAHNPPTEPTVLDFIPRTSSVFLSITPTDSEDSLTVLQVQEMLVRRVARPGVVAFGTGDDAVPPTDGWTHTAPEGMQVVWALDSNSVISTASAPFEGGITYSEGDGVSRALYGLRPGSRYRLMIEFTADYSESDTDPVESVDPFINITNADGIVATHTEDNPGTGQHFWVIEFNALSTSGSIGLSTNDDLTIGSYGFVRWDLQEYMVEEILETDGTPPRPGRFQERTMYEVKASQGPILTNVRRSSCGVMGQITYSLRAGNPFKYRSPIFAGGLPAGVSQTVPDVPCSDDGLPQIINYAYNPSVEDNATDWTAAGSNVTGTRTSSPSARVGDYVFRGNAPAGGRLNALNAYYVVDNVTSGPIPQPGQEITVSLYFRAVGAQFTGLHTWFVYVTMEGFDPISFEGEQNVTVSGQWYRLEQTLTLPDNVQLSQIEVNVFAPSTVTQGGNMDIDGLMIQDGPLATEPFDQTTPDTSWSGDPNTSAILLDQVVVDVSEDPDCPTPPAPPAPPQIDDECIDVPDAYNRTVVSVSADTVPKNLTAYPVITLVAGSEAVRQARIRFWENPDSLQIDDLDPCAYDGEIIVSYLADGATMVIDGVLREATVSKPGFVDVNANHVLYGPDGGPVDWPELSGGIPYLVTLELDSDEPYTDTLMLVDLVVRD